MSSFDCDTPSVLLVVLIEVGLLRIKQMEEEVMQGSDNGTWAWTSFQMQSGIS